MKLFTVAKVGLYLDTITHGTEKRRGDVVKIVALVLRVQPFDAQLASAMADGVRATLFRLNNAEPKDQLRRVDFALGVPRQNLHVFASPDTDAASIVLEQVKVASTYARAQKDVAGFAFVFKASFGPLGRRELEYVHDWHLSQRFVTCDVAEPGMFDDDGDESAETDDDEPAAGGPSQNVVPAHMFEGPLGPATVPAADDATHRPLHSHQSRRGGRRLN